MTGSELVLYQTAISTRDTRMAELEAELTAEREKVERLRGVLIAAREELNCYNSELYGESYNSPQINEAISATEPED